MPSSILEAEEAEDVEEARNSERETGEESDEEFLWDELLIEDDDDEAMHCSE